MITHVHSLIAKTPEVRELFNEITTHVNMKVNNIISILVIRQATFVQILYCTQQYIYNNYIQYKVGHM